MLESYELTQLLVWNRLELENKVVICRNIITPAYLRLNRSWCVLFLLHCFSLLAKPFGLTSDPNVSIRRSWFYVGGKGRQLLLAGLGAKEFLCLCFDILCTVFLVLVSKYGDTLVL